VKQKTITYLDKAGPKECPKCLAATVERARELKIKHAVVATTSGKTALALARAFAKAKVKCQVVGVGYAQNYAEKWGHLDVRILRAAEKLDVQFVRGGHAMGGINSGIQDKFGTLSPNKIVANTYYTIGHGFKVAMEVVMMAADACAIPLGEEVMALGGAGKGADTSLVVLSKSSADFFDLRVREIVCMPRSSKRK
jgi:uncharacterized protein